MNNNFTRTLAMASSLAFAGLTTASTLPSFLMSSKDGTAYESLILEQFPANATTNVGTYLNYGRYASATSKVVGLVDFNNDDVLDVVYAAKDPVSLVWKWKITEMADFGTASHGRQNYSPIKTVWLPSLNATAPDAFGIALGALKNSAGNFVVYVKNPTTGSIRAEEISQTAGVYSLVSELTFTTVTTEYTDTVAGIADPTTPTIPAFLMMYKTNTIAGIYRPVADTYSILLDADNSSVNFGTTTSPVAVIDINGNGTEDILVAPAGRARRAWLLNAAGQRTANQTVLGARPYQIGWDVVAWGGGTKH